MRWLWLLLFVAANAQAAKPGSLRVESPIVGATVEIDGRVVGKTPLRAQPFTAGKHTVKVRKLGFLELTEQVVVIAGRSTNVFADLLPFAGVIVVRANVKGAQVSVDGQAVGTVPLEHEVKLGKHRIVVTASGHEPFTRDVAAEPGQTYTIEAQLQRTGGAGDDLELALVPLAAPKGGSDDDLELEPLPELVAPVPRKTSPAAPGTQPPTAVSSVEPARPWYMESWAWGAAAGVLAAGTVLAFVLADDGGFVPPNYPDVYWQLPEQ